MNGKNAWNLMCDEIQDRSIKSTLLTISKASELRTEIFKCLNTARNDRVLKTKLEEIHKLLKMTSPDKSKTAIVGGERNFKRSKNIPHFERVDGCWFDFSILLDETPKPAAIIGFDFEIRFPEDSQVKFLILKMTSPDKSKTAIVGGERNFKRSKNIPHFERVDGCWFDFSILLDETPKPAAIIGFDFEIRFPEDSQVKFLRFDLNLPNHDNEERGMRFHLHPGSDDFMIHSPSMTPLEILHLFLYGLSIPEKPRSL